jgi:hypothetical protein
MSKSSNGRVSSPRPVVAMMAIEFETDIDNDTLRSTNWWKERFSKLPGIKNVKVSMDRSDVKIKRPTK